MGFDYTSAKWKTTRNRVLRRDRYQCRICRRYGRNREALEVHHIQPVEIRPDLAFSMDNLVSLCHACHNKQHPEKARNLGRRY